MQRQWPIVLTAPIPPSVNKMFRNVPGKGRVKTSGYAAFQKECAVEFMRQKPPRLIKRRVVINVGIPRKHRGADIDNRVKALFDAMVGYGVISDDKMITAFCISWLPNVRQAKVWLAIYPCVPLRATFTPAVDGITGAWQLTIDAENQGTENGDQTN